MAGSKTLDLNEYFEDHLRDSSVLGAFTNSEYAWGDGDFVITGKRLRQLGDYPAVQAFLEDVSELMAREEAITPRASRG